MTTREKIQSAIGAVLMVGGLWGMCFALYIITPSQSNHMHNITHTVGVRP